MSDRISNTCHICQIKFVSHSNSMTMHPIGKVLSYALTQSQWITGSSFREVAGVREEKHTYHSDSLRCIHPVWLQSISGQPPYVELGRSTPAFLYLPFSLFYFKTLRPLTTHLPPWHLFVNSIPPLSILTPSVSLLVFSRPGLSHSSWSRPLAAVNLTADGLVFLARSLFLSVCVCVCVCREREGVGSASRDTQAVSVWMKIVNALCFLLLPLSLSNSLSLSPSLFVSFPPLHPHPTLLRTLFFLSPSFRCLFCLYSLSSSNIFTLQTDVYIFILSPFPSFLSPPRLNTCTHIHALLIEHQTLNPSCSVSHYPKYSWCIFVSDSLCV